MASDRVTGATERWSRAAGRRACGAGRCWTAPRFYYLWRADEETAFPVRSSLAEEQSSWTRKRARGRARNKRGHE